MKKKLILWAAIAVVLIAAVLVLVIPRPLIGELDDVSGVYYELEEVNDQIDMDRLRELLLNARTIPSFDFLPYTTVGDCPIEISVIEYKGNHLVIVMGEKNFSYKNEWSMRTILDGDELYADILEMIK